MASFLSGLRSTLILFAVLPSALSAPALAGPTDEARAEVRRGNQHFDRGELVEARAAYQRALEHIPDFGRALINLGIVEVRMGRAKEGAALCRRAQEREERTLSKVEYCLGLAAARDRRPKEAAERFARSIQSSPQDPGPRIELARLLEKGRRFSEALPHYQQLVQLKPESAENHLRLGYCYKQLEQWKQAEASYRASLKRDPKSFFAHLNLGVVLSRAGKSAEAETHYRRAAEIRPSDATPHHNLGNLERRRGRYAEAYRAYRKAVALGPKDAENHVALAKAAWHLGDRAAAAQSLDRAEKLHPPPSLLKAIGHMRQQMKKHTRPPKAVRIIRPGDQKKKAPRPGGRSPTR